MTQETGETRDAIIEDSNKRLQDIIYANRHRQEKYWVVLYAKPTRNTVNGFPALAQHIKAYGEKPKSQVGMVIGEVDPLKSTISWEVNMPQAPFDFDALRALGAKAGDTVVTETTTIPGAYVTQ